ncbi:uncharacterized protein BDR25DRAFT_364056 [Lindgomyces ingoldianus]|uniref:Uncharacterized protein n=1 Tax=Lindgomyces ingoldianus TaxID=673940 RepID=A0ACB6Q6J1_9PLEO|nr:uncharacterized protein BDR25DRAFT_364056 [Lindgomyces ingoldianus]KAF2462493.1 hypothetical protein BDR25DRAFT_364056 [Lindgomyces ingoldianus]
MHPYSFCIWVFGGIERHPPPAFSSTLCKPDSVILYASIWFVGTAFRFLVESNTTHLQLLCKPDSVIFRIQVFSGIEQNPPPAALQARFCNIVCIHIVFGGIKHHPPPAISSSASQILIMDGTWLALGASRIRVFGGIEQHPPPAALQARFCNIVLAAFGFLVESNTIHLQRLCKPDSVILYASVWFVGSFWWNQTPSTSSCSKSQIL